MTPGGWSGDCVSLTPSAGSGPRVQGDHTHKAKKKGRIHESLSCVWTSLIAQLVKKSTCDAGDPRSIRGLGRSAGEGKGYPLQYPDLENSMHCTVYGITKSRTQLSDFHFTHFC